VAELDELEQLAAEALPAPAYDFYAGGADDEITLQENLQAWRRLRLRPRTLRDVRNVTTGVEVLGTRVRAPILVAPTSFLKMAHPEGETAVAVGTAEAGSLMVVSTRTTVPLDDIAAAASDSPRWFQVYILKDRDWTAEIVARAAELGYRALVLTVDAPVVGRRRRDEKNAFSFPDDIRPAHLPSGLGAGVGEVRSYPGAAYLLPSSSEGDPAEHDPAEHDAGGTFDDIGWLKSVSGLPVVVKGVLRGDDASACVRAGAAGVIVSNHGGRQLDSVIATAEALPGVVSAVSGAAEVYVDGGIRKGTDVLKAIALGADAVLIGRPVIWGLATGGSKGVQQVLEGLTAELMRAMSLCGATNVGEISEDLVAARDQ
jgi:4-hydroxymandelate oxidase